jgi:hypothetical protein
VPVFAAEVYDQNARLIDAGLTPINLQSVMIGTIVYVLRRLLVIDLILGNGETDFATNMLSYYDIQCTPASVPPFLSIS